MLISLFQWEHKKAIYANYFDFKYVFLLQQRASEMFSVLGNPLYSNLLSIIQQTANVYENLYFSEYN